MTCAASSGRLDEGCHLAAAEDSLRSVIPSGANIHAESDSPSQKSLPCKVEAQSVSRIFADPALPRHRRLHLDACRVPGAGAWVTANPSSADTHVPSHLFRTGRPCPLVGCGGDKILRHNAIRDVVCSAVFEFTTVSPELERSQASFSLRGPLTLEVLTSAFVSLLVPRLLLLLLDVVLLMSGSQGVCPVSLRLGISRSQLCSALPTSLRLPRRLLMFSTRSRLASVLSTAPPPRWPNVGPPSSRLSWRLAGGGGRIGWSQAFRAVVTWIASESRTARGLSTDLPRDTSLRIAQRISCTLHRENARAILRRSPGSINGSTGLVDDQVPSSGW